VREASARKDPADQSHEPAKETVREPLDPSKDLPGCRRVPGRGRPICFHQVEHGARIQAPVFVSLSGGRRRGRAETPESGVEFRLDDITNTIRVPSEKVAELRLQMATAGLPKTGRIGYELFDKTNFGVTDFAEHINYQRALEGEWSARSYRCRGATSAVHINFSKDSVFLESRRPAKASVLLGLRRRPGLCPERFRNLLSGLQRGGGFGSRGSHRAGHAWKPARPSPQGER